MSEVSLGAQHVFIRLLLFSRWPERLCGTRAKGGLGFAEAPMRIRGSLLLLATLTAAGCGGDGGTSPTGPANVEGTWSFEAHGLTTAGSDTKCGMTGTLQMAQEGAVVTGSYVIDRLTCTSPQGTEVLPGPWGGSIVNGTVEGNRVHFHFDTDDADQHGTVSGNRMSGTCTWRYENATLTGNWSATRS